MAAFATMALAEARVRTLTANHTIIQGHSCRLKNGTIAIRVLRYVTKATFTGQDTEAKMNKAGGIPSRTMREFK